MATVGMLAMEFYKNPLMRSMSKARRGADLFLDVRSVEVFKEYRLHLIPELKMFLETYTKLHQT